MAKSSTLILGIDTGGSYTDGVIIDRETQQLLRTAKALTTHHDLTLGMEACMRALDFDRWAQIGQISLSTTLATNAIVENKGSRVGVVVLGKRPRGDLPAAVCVELEAQVNIRGMEQERLTQDALDAAMQQLRGSCEAVAISGYASVRNPTHELQVAHAVRETLGLPVVCGHELTGALGFYERTVTAALNARLIPIIRSLIATVAKTMEKFDIHAPLLIVRGDGSLMRAEYAAERPVETVLSGPAASVTGARFLSGETDCLVVDMGGTTTDIAYVNKGRCTVSDEGARLATWRTRVRALDICTYGLGGDSHIQPGADRASIGPRRVVPFCRAQEGAENVGLTPTDLLHIMGEYCQWSTAKAAEGLRSVCPAGETAESLRGQVVRQLADYCAQGRQAFAAPVGAVVVGVGAPAQIWLVAAAKELGIGATVPEHADVANAVGAAVGQVQEVAHAFVRPNRVSGRYDIYTAKGRQRAEDMAQAEQVARESVVDTAASKARLAGAHAHRITVERCETRGENGEFIELRLWAEACGYPT